MADTEIKQKLRPLYSELQGYLSQAPNIKATSDCIYDPSQWEQVNNTVDILNTISGKDYNRFKIKPEGGEGDGNILRVATFRNKLGGIINYLHGEYFFDEPAPPLSGNPSMVFNHTLSQQQSQQQSMTVALLELQSKIDEKLAKTTDEKEKSFLQKLKDQLPTVISVAQLIQLILTITHQTGLDPQVAGNLLA